LTTRLASS